MTFGEAVVKWIVGPIFVLAMLPILVQLVMTGVLVVVVSILCVGAAVALVTFLYRIARSTALPRRDDPAFPPTPVQRPRLPRGRPRW